MFSGIIEQCGQVSFLDTLPANFSAAVNLATMPDHGVRLHIACQPALWTSIEGAPPLSLGESIAVDGMCLTAVRWLPDGFDVDVSPESLRVAKSFLQEDGKTALSQSVNLERALRYGQLVGGHLVSGHLDGVGIVTAINPRQSFRELIFRLPSDLGDGVVRKGCIAINGCSLTINEVSGDEFSVMVIPHTLTHTNLNTLSVGARVNVEIDLMAKYVLKRSTPPHQSPT